MDKLGLQQLHLDNQEIKAQNENLALLLKLLSEKDFKTVLPEIFKVKADALPPVTIDGDVKAVVDGGTVTVLNLAELEAYFLGLQFALVEAIGAPQTVTTEVPLPVSVDKLDQVLALLKNIADKDTQITVEGKSQAPIVLPKRAGEAIAVRLVTADGKSFYTARGPGGGSSPGVGIPDRLIEDDRLKVTTDGEGGSGGPITNDGTFASETGNLANLANGQVDGSQVTKLRYDGVDVDPNHPLPVAGTFSDENGVPFSTANPLPTSVQDMVVEELNVSFPASVISTVNTTNTPLGANATFTGQWEDVTQYSAIIAAVLTDQASADNGAVVQFSADGVDVLKSTAVSVPAGIGLSFSFPPEARYVRFIYTNGAVAQTILEAQIMYSYQTPGQVLVPLATQTNDLFTGTITSSHLKARHSSGAWFPLEHDGVGLRVSTGLTDLKVHDDYQTGEILADQVGAGGVLTFTFSEPVHMLWINDIGATTTNVSRADPFGGTPNATTGITVPNGTPTPITVTTSSVKVYAPTGSTISVYGYRRT